MSDDGNADNASSTTAIRASKRKQPRFVSKDNNIQTHALLDHGFYDPNAPSHARHVYKKPVLHDSKLTSTLSVAAAKPVIAVNRFGYLDNEPSVDKAMRYRNLTCVRKKTQTGYRKWRIWSYRLDQMRQYGLGTVLYFKQARTLGYMFVLNALLAIPQVILHATTKSGVQAKHLIELDSLMWGKQVYDPTTTAAAAAGVPTGLIDRRLLASICVTLDFFICLIYLFGTYLLARDIASEVHAYKTKEVTLANYTVYVSNFDIAVPRLKSVGGLTKGGKRPPAQRSVRKSRFSIGAAQLSREQLDKRLACSMSQKYAPDDDAIDDDYERKHDDDDDSNLNRVLSDDDDANYVLHDDPLLSRMRRRPHDKESLPPPPPPPPAAAADDVDVAGPLAVKPDLGRKKTFSKVKQLRAEKKAAAEQARTVMNGPADQTPSSAPPKWARLKSKRAREVEKTQSLAQRQEAQRQHEEEKNLKISLQLHRIFSHHGKVHDIAVVYNNYHIVLQYVQRGLLRMKMAAAYVRDDVALWSKLAHQLSQLDTQMERLSAAHHPRAIGAFITFTDVAAANDCVRMHFNSYRAAKWGTLRHRCCRARHPNSKSAERKRRRQRRRAKRAMQRQARRERAQQRRADKKQNVVRAAGADVGVIHDDDDDDNNLDDISDSSHSSDDSTDDSIEDVELGEADSDVDVTEADKQDGKHAYWHRHELRQRGHQITINGEPFVVNAADEPSNVMFEHLATGRWSYAARRTISVVIVVAMLLVTTGMVFGVSQYIADAKPHAGICPDDIDRDDARGDTQLTNCYCAALGQDVLREDDDRLFCSEWFRKWVYVQSLQLAQSVCITIGNVAFHVLIPRLAEFEQLPTATQTQRTIAVKLFVGIFVNTSLVLAMVYGDYSRYTGQGIKVVFNGAYTDFTPEWYENVSVPISLAFIFNALMPHVASFIRVFTSKLRRRMCIEYQATQDDLNKLFAGEVFQLSERYGALLNSCFGCFLFSAGLPLMNVIAAISFVTVYWFDKTSFLRLYQAPIRYGPALAQTLVRMMPLALLPHCVMAIWMYTVPGTDSYDVWVPSTTFNTTTTATGAIVTTGGYQRGELLTFAPRIAKFNGFLPFMMLCIACVYIVCSTLFGVWFLALPEIIQMCFRRLYLRCCTCNKNWERDEYEHVMREDKDKFQRHTDSESDDDDAVRVRRHDDDEATVHGGHAHDKRREEYARRHRRTRCQTCRSTLWHCCLGVLTCGHHRRPPFDEHDNPYESDDSDMDDYEREQRRKWRERKLEEEAMRVVSPHEYFCHLVELRQLSGYVKRQQRAARKARRRRMRMKRKQEHRSRRVGGASAAASAGAAAAAGSAADAEHKNQTAIEMNDRDGGDDHVDDDDDDDDDDHDWDEDLELCSDDDDETRLRKQRLRAERARLHHHKLNSLEKMFHKHETRLKSYQTDQQLRYRDAFLRTTSRKQLMAPLHFSVWQQQQDETRGASHAPDPLADVSSHEGSDSDSDEEHELESLVTSLRGQTTDDQKPDEYSRFNDDAASKTKAELRAEMQRLLAEKADSKSVLEAVDKPNLDFDELMLHKLRQRKVIEERLKMREVARQARIEAGELDQEAMLSDEDDHADEEESELLSFVPANGQRVDALARDAFNAKRHKQQTESNISQYQAMMAKSYSAHAIERRRHLRKVNKKLRRSSITHDELHEHHDPHLHLHSSVVDGDSALHGVELYLPFHQNITIHCRRCHNQFEIVDAGIEAVYTCPYCSAQVSM